MQGRKLILNRRGVALGLLLLAGGRSVHAAPCSPPTVLFVCPAGSVKSAIAREMLKRRAAERRVSISVTSRGIHVEDHLSPGLRASLLADGIDPTAEPLRGLEPRDAAHADILIAFEEAALAPGLAQARVWDIPSWNSRYAEAKAATSSNIEALLDELGRRPCAVG